MKWRVEFSRRERFAVDVEADTMKEAWALAHSPRFFDSVASRTDGPHFHAVSVEPVPTPTSTPESA